MRARLLPLLLLVAPAGAAVRIGGYGHWAAMRDGGRCVARTAAVRGRGGLAVTSAPRAGVPAQVHVDLPAEPRADSNLFLVAGGRRFRLIWQGRDAWAANARDDGAAIAALRRATVATLDGFAADGRRFRVTFPLDGAPSAIDAAIVACL